MALNTSFRDFSDLEALKVQLRELSVRQNQTEDQVNQLDRSARDETIDIVPPFVNFVDNSDFLFSDETYDGIIYTDSDKVLYGWFQRAQSASTAWDDPAGTAPTNHGVTTLGYTAGSFPSINCYWDTATGSLVMVGGTRLAARLDQRRGYAGNYMAVRFQVTAIVKDPLTIGFANVAPSGAAKLQFTSVAHNYHTGIKGRFTNSGGGLPTGLAVDTDYWLVRTGDDTFEVATSYANATTTPTPVTIAWTDAGTGNHTFTPTFVAPATTMKAKVSLWGQAAPAIITGGVIPTTAVLGGVSGSVRRDYILEICMADGSRHYSNTAIFTDSENRVLNTVSCVTPSTTNFVTLSWSPVIGASRYKVYRNTPTEANTDWYLVGTTTTNSVRDTGGYIGTPWTIPYPTEVYKLNQKAETFFDDIGDLLQTQDAVQEVVLAFNMPQVISGDTGKQYLQVEFLDEDFTATEASSFSGLRIDKVGLSYTNGRWCPSANDQLVSGGEIVTNPPPSGGGGAGNPTGGGLDTCIEENTLVRLWSPPEHTEWSKAKDVVVGDLLLSYDEGSGELAPTRVRRTISGMSTGNYILHFKNGSLQCTMSHSVITDGKWKYGTSVRKLGVGDSVMALDGLTLTKSEIVGIEALSNKQYVRTFDLDRNRRNYVTWGGYFSHNLKDSNTNPDGEVVV